MSPSVRQVDEEIAEVSILVAVHGCQVMDERWQDFLMAEMVSGYACRSLYQSFGSSNFENKIVIP